MLDRCFRSAAAVALVLAGAGCGSDGSSILGPDQSHSGSELCLDDLAPSLSAISATPPSLWPPNHEMVPVDLNYLVTDGNLTGVSLAISSDEPENGIGDGNTAPDWSIDAVGAAGARVLLRAERAGPGDGRVYTIDVIAADACDHTTTGRVQVVIPHDQGRD